MAFDGEPVIVSRKENKNVVIISEAEYNELAKAKKNAEYIQVNRFYDLKATFHLVFLSFTYFL